MLSIVNLQAYSKPRIDRNKIKMTATDNWIYYNFTSQEENQLIHQKNCVGKLMES